VLQWIAMCCCVSLCLAVCCSVLQCVAVCCSVWQCVAVRWSVSLGRFTCAVSTLRRYRSTHIPRGETDAKARSSCANHRDAPSPSSPGTCRGSAMLYVHLYIHIYIHIWKQTYMYMKRDLGIYEKRPSCANCHDSPSSVCPRAHVVGL